MNTRLFRPLAVLLSVLLFSGTSAHAGPVSVRQVVLVLGRYQNPSKLELRQVSQVSDLSRATQEPSRGRQTAGKAPDSNGTGTGDSLLTGVEVDPQNPVSVISQGDIEGTICDCGEIVVPVGGFPKWPLFFVGVIPFFFIHHDKDTPPVLLGGLTPTPTPTPLPTATPVPQIPEPASLLLLFSGVATFGACWRRRRVLANRIIEKTGARENG